MCSCVCVCILQSSIFTLTTTFIFQVIILAIWATYNFCDILCVFVSRTPYRTYSCYFFLCFEKENKLKKNATSSSVKRPKNIYFLFIVDKKKRKADREREREKNEN